jgi:hypothetical protein
MDEYKPKIIKCSFQRPPEPDMSQFLKLNCDEWDVSACDSVEGGGTGLEFTSNLKKDGQEDWNKWYDANSGETWIEATFPTALRIKAFQLKSANDCPGRDPYEITVSVRRPDSQEWEQLHNQSSIFFDNRFENKLFVVDTQSEVSAFRVTINRNLAEATGNFEPSGTQLAQFTLYK